MAAYEAIHLVPVHAPDGKTVLHYEAHPSSNHSLPSVKETPDASAENGPANRLPQKYDVTLYVEGRDTPVQCVICNKQLKDLHTLKAHSVIHSESRPFLCDWPGCNDSFKTKGSLKRHMRRHTDDRPFVCDKCHRSFRESGALTRHLKSRVPCTKKRDVDLPMYGKRKDMNGMFVVDLQEQRYRGTAGVSQEDTGESESTAAVIRGEGRVEEASADVPAEASTPRPETGEGETDVGTLSTEPETKPSQDSALPQDGHKLADEVSNTPSLDISLSEGTASYTSDKDLEGGNVPHNKLNQISPNIVVWRGKSPKTIDLKKVKIIRILPQNSAASLRVVPSHENAPPPLSNARVENKEIAESETTESGVGAESKVETKIDCAKTAGETGRNAESVSGTIPQPVCVKIEDMNTANDRRESETHSEPLQAVDDSMESIPVLQRVINRGSVKVSPVESVSVPSAGEVFCQAEEACAILTATESGDGEISDVPDDTCLLQVTTCVAQTDVDESQGAIHEAAAASMSDPVADVSAGATGESIRAARALVSHRFGHITLSAASDENVIHTDAAPSPVGEHHEDSKVLEEPLGIFTRKRKRSEGLHAELPHNNNRPSKKCKSADVLPDDSCDISLALTESTDVIEENEEKVVTSEDLGLIAADVDSEDLDDDVAVENETQNDEDVNREECQACNKRYTDEEDLKTHLKTHLRTAGYKCPVAGCKCVLPDKSRLLSHLEVVHRLVREGGEGNEDENETHNQVDTKTAQVALKQLLELQGNLDTEVHSMGNQQVKVLHACPVCSRSFPLNYLKLHIRAHTGERPHTCPHCGKTFRTRDTLGKHVQTHSRVRSYKCGECHKTFKRLSHVREHLKVHSNERQYPCPVCSKAFKSSNACKVHMRTHQEVLPYVCSYCKRAFREKSALERHTRTHTGEKPFVCKKCGRGFAEHGTLNRHMKAKVPCTSNLNHSKYSDESRDSRLGTVYVQSALQAPQEVVQLVPSSEEVTSEEVGHMSADALLPKVPSLRAVLGHSVLDSDGGGGGVLAGEEGSGVLVEGGGSVLAEFSSVVADAQQYVLDASGHAILDASGHAILDASGHAILDTAGHAILDTAGHAILDNSCDAIQVIEIAADEQEEIDADLYEGVQLVASGH